MKKFTLILAVLFAGVSLSKNLNAQQHYTISRFDTNIISNVFPTPYIKAKFSILETSNAGNFGFTKSQINKDIIIELPDGFVFKTDSNISSVMVNGGGTDCQVVSWNFVGDTIIQAFLTIGIARGQLNSIYFKDFLIRATKNASGDILRTGGTLKIDYSINCPTSNESLGYLSTNIINNIKETNTIQNFIIYPNPAKDKLIVTTEGKAEVKVFDIRGQLKYSRLFNEHDVINLSNYSKGIYIIQITSDNKIYNCKFIKE